MDEMPGMIRPDLQALPQVKDRMTFLYLEHCTLGRQDGAITVTDEKGVIPLPLTRWNRWSSFPRTCGGDPTCQSPLSCRSCFSPHMRG